MGIMKTSAYPESPPTGGWACNLPASLWRHHEPEMSRPACLAAYRLLLPWKQKPMRWDAALQPDEGYSRRRPWILYLEMSPQYHSASSRGIVLEPSLLPLLHTGPMDFGGLGGSAEKSQMEIQIKQVPETRNLSQRRRGEGGGGGWRGRPNIYLIGPHIIMRSYHTEELMRKLFN